ncbi:aldose epimerase family protein [Marimonas sp. MJW-29]|uniref:Aldose epimerase family protein n=1 Tax=Sulfitobacter sediminis TaxID=3234186 RepID=A0ABV3RJN3_9RHOB
MDGLTPIKLATDSLRAAILPKGATLAALRLGPDGDNLVLGFRNPRDHVDVPAYVGPLVGPVANRIAEGRVNLGGKSYQMPRNENGETCLHSGAEGLHAQVFEVRELTKSAVTLALTLPDGAQGLPGRREIAARYSVEGSCLTLEIFAKTDRTTPMNIAAHPYWKFDDRPDVSGHLLQISAEKYLPTDERKLPTGEIRSVTGTDLDFRTPRPVPLTPALDVNYCLARQQRPETAPCATLKGATGITLHVSTDAPGLQIYNGAFLPRIAGVLDNGGNLAPYGGIAIEPQFWPDAPRHAGFPSIILHPGETWRQTTHFRLTLPG